jgi:WD40 repeat protein
LEFVGFSFLSFHGWVVRMEIQRLLFSSRVTIDAKSLFYYDRLSAAMCNWLVMRHSKLLWISLYKRQLRLKRGLFTLSLLSIVLWYALILPFSPTHVVSAHSDAVNEMALSSNGAFLVTEGDDGLVRVWSVEKKAIKLKFEDHAHFVTDLAFSPDARLLVVFDVVYPTSVTKRPINRNETTAMRVYDVNSGLLVRDIPFRKIANSVAFSPDGKSLFITDAVDGIREWDTTSWKECRFLGKPGGGEGKTTISPNGNFLATGVRWGGIVIWDLQRACVHWEKDDEPSGCISSLAFSPDGTTLASGTLDGVVKIWDAATGAEKDMLRVAHSVYCVSYSPDQKFLAVGSSPLPLEGILSFGLERGGAGLYNIGAGEWRKAYRWHKLGVRRLAFTPDGAFLITSDAAGVVRFWPLPKH